MSPPSDQGVADFPGIYYPAATVSSLWVQGAASLNREGQSTLVVIGNFDGVHRGHQTLLSEATRRSQERVLRPVVLTFVPHPAGALGRVAPPLLTTLERKVELIRCYAPDIQVVVHPFDRSFASRTPEQFAFFLIDQLGAREVVVGRNFRFGQGRSGDFTTLSELGQRLGFQVGAIALAGDEVGAWSSTRVREALAIGALEDANRVLGRPHELEGIVIPGQQRARHLGFPTANLSNIPQAIPAHGVYAVQALRLSDHGDPELLGEGMANIGLRPTVAAGFAVEVHLFGFSADLYGARLRIRLIARLREERVFAGLDELKAQIAKDAEAARAALCNATEKP
ncbi:MAG: riboflavin biosynthesis protein RibF [Myxococcales bacterium]|nr:riboflavin biosynthesis protein RibF [Polyangiaceae bacterium]MDW8251549.1 riboflavin biosynthesis protein RibF [Myxococcales bacterium]